MKNRTFWWYFKRVLFGFPLLLFIYFGFITKETWGINKTVGWAWDITNINFWNGVVFAIVLALLIIAIVSFLLKKLFDFFND